MSAASYRATGANGTSVEVRLVSADPRAWEVVVERPPSRFGRLIAELRRHGPPHGHPHSVHRKSYEVPDSQLDDVLRVNLGRSRSAEELLTRIRADHPSGGDEPPAA